MKRANTKMKPNAGTWKKGQPSPNPKGRPREGESWAAVLTWASNLTGAEAARMVPPEMAKFFRPLKGLKLKQAIVLRVMTALLFEPSSALFNAVLDRIEGPIEQRLRILKDDELDDLIAGLFAQARPGDFSKSAPGEGAAASKESDGAN